MRTAWRAALLVLVSALALQLYFAGRVALMRFVDPRSTTFQRSEAWRLNGVEPAVPWQQQWLDDAGIAASLKRAVIASEDAGFARHGGVEWDALEKAWERNRKEEARSGRMAEALARRFAARATKPGLGVGPGQARVVGGSTITQQLAKNLFLSGERDLARKGQELVVTFLLEALLPKERILEIYLNSVEWGAGVFGAEAAARHYFRAGAGSLTPLQAAQLAVILPAPKRFEKRPGSPYVIGRAATVAARMGAVELP